MSIFSSFKKALGFPDEYDEEEEEMHDADSSGDSESSTSHTSSVGMRIEVKPLRHNQGKTHYAPEGETTNPSETSNDESTGSTAGVVVEQPPITDELPGQIFDAVIRLFNSTQPDFVTQCLDIDSQRTYLLNHIDESARQLIVDVAENARRRGEEQWNATQAALEEENRRLMEDYNSLKHQREEFQSQHLSSKRQRRALDERVRDLESKLAEQSAEIEQYQLENRSMASRLRAMTVRAGINADDPSAQLAAENVALSDQLKDLTAQVEALQTAADEARRQAADSTAALDEANNKINNLQTQLAEQTEAESIAAEQQAAIEDIEARMQQFEEIKARKDKKIATLGEQNRALTEEIALARQQLESAHSGIESLQTAHDDLLTTNESLKKANDALRTEIETLRNAPVPAVTPVDDSAEVAELKAEVRRLSDLINAAAVEAPAPKSKRGRKKKNRHQQSVQPGLQQNFTPSVFDNEDNLLTPDDSESQNEPTTKISAIDELMDSTDWFKAPDPVPIRKDPEVEEEFGYKEPVRKPTLESDNQLSLF